jgi:hypothetical protein
MGTYSELRIGHLEIFASKSHPPRFALTLFRAADRIAFTDPDGGVTCAYRITAALAKDRLHLMGFTFERARAEYESVRAQRIEQLRGYEDEDDEPDAFWQEEIQRINAFDFDAFVASSRHIFNSGLDLYALHEQGDKDPLVNRLVTSFDHDYEWDFYCQDPRSLARVLLELVPADTVVQVDLSALIEAGYCELDDDYVAMALATLRGTYSVDAPIIVLTEGVTDFEVLSRSMGLLYPGLRDYYRFLDYAARPAGGASHLATAVRTFIAAGIENRIIALFDNDAEGQSQLRMLRRQALPSNVRVFAYPDTELARTYPAHGPTGFALQDVNGGAASIELYFGQDVLRDQAGQLATVHWKGRIDERGGPPQYQGEVERKNDLKQRFLEKLARCEADRGEIDDGAWLEMKQILGALFRAFQD